MTRTECKQNYLYAVKEQVCGTADTIMDILADVDNISAQSETVSLQQSETYIKVSNTMSLTGVRQTNALARNLMIKWEKLQHLKCAVHH